MITMPRSSHTPEILARYIQNVISESEYMTVLRMAREWRGLSYQELARRWARRSPRNALARASVADLFRRDTLPRKGSQLDDL
ncbi:hypothetical protein, partial [Saccharopolyspora taberi]|uniref:hypothetical protein n=1 Tax=Saccharopolyspora taberi TaxID=60895 RepID=UPI0031E03115